mmetsp:Transcript_1750/g.1213  ORF Transcript_1750/g.1213 Transcript_1750/m.1213 type:complete len:98 (-) Transcript_1750:579-872(-)
MSDEVIYGLRGEIEGLKREKQFIMEKDQRTHDEMQKRLDEEREKVLKLMEEKATLKAHIETIATIHKKQEERKFGEELQNLERKKQEEKDAFRLNKA